MAQMYGNAIGIGGVEAIALPRAERSDIRFVYFDCFDVLVEHRRHMYRRVRAAGKVAETVFGQMEDLTRQADVGMVSFAAWQASFNELLGIGTKDPMYRILPTLKRIEPMHQLVESLRVHNIPYGLVSNAGLGAIEEAAELGLLPEIPSEVTIVSSRLRVAKPGPEIYEHASAAAANYAGVAPEHIGFIDDQARNVHMAAVSEGWQGFVPDTARPYSEVQRIAHAVGAPITRHLVSAI